MSCKRPSMSNKSNDDTVLSIKQNKKSKHVDEYVVIANTKRY